MPQLNVRDLYSAATADLILGVGLPHATQHRTWSGEVMMRRRDGSEVPVSQVIVAHTDTANQVQFHSTIMRDISAARQAQQALQKSEGALRAFMDALPTPALLLDRSGTLLAANAALRRTWGEADWVGRNARDLPEALSAAWRSAADQVFAGRGQIRFEEERDGQHYFTCLSPVTDSQGGVAGVAIFSLDLTERRKLEEQLRQAQKMEAIGKLCGGVAHDFNNILTVVQGHISLLATTADLPPDVKDAVLEIGQAAERATQLTRQLLAFSRRQVIRPSLLDLNEIITNIAKLLQRLLGEDVRIEFHLQGQPLLVQADPGMLDQVVMNLAVNARDAMPNGGQLLLKTTIETLGEAEARSLSDVEPGQYQCLSVSDSGCGMNEEVRAHLFEPFFTTKPAGRGTGLGLATVFGIVRQHRGIIRVYSEVGRGTTFRILLPAAAESELPAPQNAAVTPARGGTETILLVEDDLAVRRLTRTVLRHYGYQIVEAANGPEALRLFASAQPPIQLLLTDLVMPEGMSGQQVAARLQQEKPPAQSGLYERLQRGAGRARASAERRPEFPAKTHSAAPVARHDSPESGRGRVGPARYLPTSFERLGPGTPSTTAGLPHVRPFRAT